MQKRVEHLVVDTNAFINNAAINDVGANVYTIQEVIDEVTSRRQLRHLSVLSYDLIIKDVFTENIKFVSEFSKKTGDYLSLSATDIKVIALTYQLEKEKIGVSHLNEAPTIYKSVTSGRPTIENPKNSAGFFNPTDSTNEAVEIASGDDCEDSADDEDLHLQLEALKVNGECDEILVPVADSTEENKCNSDEENESEESEDDDSGWISISNISKVKKDINSELVDDTPLTVACITADFAMQNVLKQIGLKVATYDGRLIRQVRTFILRCTTCFKTTSIMSKHFCPNCGHTSLKKVAVTLDENGKQQIYINTRRPLTSRGKRFSLPAPRGGQHAQNPILTEDQPRQFSRPTRLARTKNNPLNDDYIAGYSPFVMRDVNSKSAVLGIRSGGEIKNWMRKNPNEARRKRK